MSIRLHSSRGLCWLSGALLLSLTAGVAEGQLSPVATYDPTDPVNSVDWSPGGAYLAIGLKVLAGDQVRVLSFSGGVLTLRASDSLGKVCDSVRWHPQSNFLAVAKNTTIDSAVRLYHFGTPSTLTLLTNIDLAANPPHAVAWKSSGNRLVVGTEDSSREVLLYGLAVTNGAVSFLSSTNLYSSRVVQRGALDWRPGHTNFAVGLEYETSPDELLVLAMRGDQSNLASCAGVDTPAATFVSAVDWSPDGNLVAAGISGGATDYLRIYRFNSANNTLTLTAEWAVDLFDVYAVDWAPGGGILAVGMHSSSVVTGKVHVYSYDAAASNLAWVCDAGLASTPYDVRWSPDGKHLAVGEGDAATGAEGEVRVYHVAYADLSVVKSASTNLASTNSPLTYSIRVENHGPTNAAGVQITDTLSPDTIFICAYSTTGTCTNAGATVTCDISNLAAGASATVTVRVQVATSAYYRITNTVSVAGHAVDLNYSNNRTSIVTTVDHDGDGISDFDDGCIDAYDPEQLDEGDGDGVGDACDNCRWDWNPGQTNRDTDVFGDACDPDDDNDGLWDWWELKWFGGETNATTNADNDADGYINSDEYLADTVPTGAAGATNFPRLYGITKADDVVVTFQSSTARQYELFYATNLFGPEAWTWLAGGPDIATGSVMHFTDPLGDDSNRLYRIRISNPFP